MNMEYMKFHPHLIITPLILNSQKTITYTHQNLKDKIKWVGLSIDGENLHTSIHVTTYKMHLIMSGSSSIS